MTNCDEVFPLLPDQARPLNIECERLFPFQEGEAIRNWSLDADWWVVNPYDPSCKPIPEKELGKNTLRFLELFKEPLANRLSFGNKTFKQLGRPWYPFERMNANKYATPDFLAFVEIATHGHFCYFNGPRVYKQTTQTVKLPKSSRPVDFLVLAGLLNSSGALFWLKQVCFNKGAGEDEERDRFVYAGNKVQQVPVPEKVGEALRGKPNRLTESLTQLSQACWKYGQDIPSLALRKLYEQPGEAYYDWNSRLSGYVQPAAGLGAPFDSTASLRRAYEKAQAIRDKLRAEMISRQEEIDWLVYAAYGLLPGDHPAAHAESEPKPLEREERPFVLWLRAEGNYDQAVKLIPSVWPAPRKKLWEVRLGTIRDNEQIRRIEQPVYKRRWDEQWKVGNEWRCGPIAYAAELVDAFEWFLREKAEWWLQHKRDSRPVEFDKWTQALWKDSRVQAAWPLAAEAYARVEYEKAREKAEDSGDPSPTPAPPSSDLSSFRGTFRRIVEKESVPAGFPFGTALEELEKKLKKPIPDKLSKIRGELNVPRERFHSLGKTQYLWAGLQFK